MFIILILNCVKFQKYENSTMNELEIILKQFQYCFIKRSHLIEMWVKTHISYLRFL